MSRAKQPTVAGAKLRRFRRGHYATVNRLWGTPNFYPNTVMERLWMTQSELADYLGVTARTVRRWEAGRCPAHVYARCLAAVVT